VDRGDDTVRDREGQDRDRPPADGDENAWHAVQERRMQQGARTWSVVPVWGGWRLVQWLLVKAKWLSIRGLADAACTRCQRPGRRGSGTVSMIVDCR
jgi:hypothetical protein